MYFIPEESRSKVLGQFINTTILIILFAIGIYIIYDLNSSKSFSLRWFKEMTSEVNEKKEYNKDIISEIANRIVDAVKPQKIILFGSYAYGNPDKNSDIDILVIMKSKLPRYKRSVPIYKALAGILIPKDIIVYTPEEVNEWVDVPQAFVTTAIAKGKPLYEKN